MDKMKLGEKLLCACALAAATVLSAFAEECAALRPGEVEVVLPEKPFPAERFAAQEMTNFLSRVLGSPVPVIEARSKGADSVAILLGRAAGFDVSAFERDAFRTKVERSSDGAATIRIAGRDDSSADIGAMLAGRGNVLRTEHATLFGVYAFLEDFAGCRFFFPGEFGTVVSRTDSIKVPFGDRTTAPVFTVRAPYIDYARAAWPGETPEMTDEAREALRRRARALEWLRLGLDTTRIPCCHGQNGFHYVERFRETHPEYLRLKEDGTRATELEFNGDKFAWNIRDLCHTSKVWDEMYEDVKAYLTGQPAASRGIPLRGDVTRFGWNGNCAGGKYVDIMPQDGFQRCGCENCKKAYTDEPNYATDLVWGQTARLARRLKDEGVKGYVTQMAYTPYGRVPDFEIPDNVLVMVARTGPWCIRDGKKLSQELGDYRAWAEKTGGKVWIWTYPHKYSATAIPDIPCMAPRAWGEYYKRAAPWIFGSFAESETDRAEFNYLNYYVFAKVAWNPELDLDTLLDDHYEKMFGAGAAEMKRLYEEMEDAWLRIAGNIVWDAYGPHPVVPSEYTLATAVYSPAKLAEWSRLCDVAAAKNAADVPARERIRHFRERFVDGIAAHFRDYMEEISVEKALKRRASEPARRNLIDPNGWSIYPAEGAVPLVDKTVKGPTDENAMHVRAIDGKAYLTGLLCRAPYLMKPNTRYRLSGFLRLRDVKPRTKHGGVYFELNNGAKNWAESNKGSRRFSGTTDWVYHEMTFETIGEINPKAFLCLRIFSADGEAWFDGMRLEEIGN